VYLPDGDVLPYQGRARYEVGTQSGVLVVYPEGGMVSSGPTGATEIRGGKVTYGPTAWLRVDEDVD
jgi:hypothetical protein